MNKQHTTLRTLIRTLIRENYNVSIVGSPISTGEKRKRGTKPEEDVLANVVLTPDDFAEFISIAQAKDMLKSYGDEEDQNIKLRIEEIKKRVGGAAANLAQVLVMRQQKNGPDALNGIIFNLPGEDGTVVPTDPAPGKTYTIPAAFRQLALMDKKDHRGGAVGKGEALAILMFGRAQDAGPEPDLIVSENLEFSVKFFETSSRMVHVGAGVEGTDAENEIVELTEFLRDLAVEKKQGRGESNIPLYDGKKSVARTQAKRLLAAIYDDIMKHYPNKTDIYFSSEEKRPDLDPTGIAGGELNIAPTAGEILQKVRRCGQLWDSTEIGLSNHDVLALLGGANMTFVAIAKDSLRIGGIDFSRKIPEIMIASPNNSQIKVSPF